MKKFDPFNVGQTAVRQVLECIGEDPDREGLQETPARVARSWGELFRGYTEDPAKHLKLFADGADGCDEMVLQTDLPVMSHCEHHMVPFIGVAHVAYLPKGKIVGLSKVARVVDGYSRRLQVQERLTTQIADCIQNSVLSPYGVGVVIEAQHYCMCMRGVKIPGAWTTTSKLTGAFRQPEVRAEFLSLVAARKR